MTRGLPVFAAAWLLTAAAAGGGHTIAGADPGAVRSSAEVPSGQPAACEDGADNDGNGLTDYPDDPGCQSAADPSEGHGDPLEVYFDRRVSLHFGDWRRARVVMFGRLTLPNAGPPECVAAMPVALERRTGAGWRSAGTVTTNEDGWYVAVRRDREGRYRVTAPRRRAALPDGSSPVCRRAAVTKAHRHR